MRLLPLCAALLLVVLAGGCGGPTSDTPAGPVLRFSAIPDEDVTGFVQKFQPVAAYLSEALGVPVEYVHSESYPASVEAFRAGRIHLAWFGGLTGVQARHLVEGALAIAQGIEDPNFTSYFIAHADTGLERSETFPEGLEGRTLSFGSRSSTSGRLMPEHFIKEATGRSPDDFFKAVVYSGNHDMTVEWVSSGKAEVGAVNYKVYDARVATGKTDPAVVKIIWQTPTYADYNFTAHPDLETTFGQGFTTRLQRAILAMEDPDLLAAFKRSGFVVARNEEFEGIRKVAETLGFLDPK